MFIWVYKHRSKLKTIDQCHTLSFKKKRKIWKRSYFLFFFSKKKTFKYNKICFFKENKDNILNPRKTFITSYNLYSNLSMVLEPWKDCSHTLNQKTPSRMNSASSLDWCKSSDLKAFDLQNFLFQPLHTRKQPPPSSHSTKSEGNRVFNPYIVVRPSLTLSKLKQEQLYYFLLMSIYQIDPYPCPFLLLNQFFF